MFARYTLLYLLPLTFICASFGCGPGIQHFSVVGTSRDPGAEGAVQVELIEGDNHMVTVSLTHLAPPERLGPTYARYVLWFGSGSGPPLMASNLEYDAESRTGRATATTPHTNFSLLVTAEHARAVSTPSDTAVISRDITTN